ncbi:MAG: YihA family ribosome biogenesis GTP-binding protein [Candidatus Cloacimonetes bacterium]|nr:YihA family ribosome biogenesis GTP-binding protein [Candidatus Cloacimonadota bacterium]
MIRIVESFFVKSAVEPQDYPASAYPEFAFAGRSNVGKSTLINLLTSHKGLAKTSSTPGKTRLLNFFLIRYKRENTEEQGFMQFTDLPGYGFAEVSLTELEKWRRMVNRFFEERLHLAGIVILVDIRHEADPKDIQMLKMLRMRKIPHCVIATKSDKIPKTRIKQTVQKLAKGLELGEAPIFPVSALNYLGTEHLIDWFEQRISG